MVMGHITRDNVPSDELLLYQQFLLALGLQEEGERSILKGIIIQILQGWSQPLWDTCLSDLSSFGQSFGLYEGASAEQMDSRRKVYDLTLTKLRVEVLPRIVQWII